MPLSVLPTEPRYWRATFAVLVPALQVGAQAAPLRQPAKQRVELGGVALQGTGGGWAGQALGHRGTSASSRMAQPPAFPLPAPANKPPLIGARHGALGQRSASLCFRGVLKRDGVPDPMPGGKLG